MDRETKLKVMSAFKNSLAYWLIKQGIEDKKNIMFDQFMNEVDSEKYDKKYNELHLQQEKYKWMHAREWVIDSIIADNMGSFTTWEDED